jgi:hypothetical protein
MRRSYVSPLPVLVGHADRAFRPSETLFMNEKAQGLLIVVRAPQLSRHVNPRGISASFLERTPRRKVWKPSVLRQPDPPGFQARDVLNVV